MQIGHQPLKSNFLKKSYKDENKIIFLRDATRDSLYNVNIFNYCLLNMS